MSMEIYVLSDRQLSSMTSWQMAIDAERFALTLDASRPFAHLRGHLPAQWQGARAGFECDHWRPESVLESYPDVRFDRRWTYCLVFRWGADPRACLGGYMAATAYARATDGVVFDPDSGKILTAEQARLETVKIEKLLPEFERQMRLMTASIKGDRGANAR
jgi:hypothetical protein